MRVKDRVVVITGAGRGLGRAIAIRLAEEGAKIVVNDIRAEDAERVVKEIVGMGKEAIFVVADISKWNEARSLIDQAIQKFSKIDILVNNAGITKDRLIKDMEETDWDEVLDINLKGAFLCSKFASESMRKNQYGKIINISSRAYLGNPGQANYSSSKAGLIGLTRSLALELGRFNINVNAIAPGMIETEGLKNHPKYPELKERFLKNTPLGRVGQPKDIANAVLFLASDESNYITGDVFHVTGGRYS